MTSATPRINHVLRYELAMSAVRSNLRNMRRTLCKYRRKDMIFAAKVCLENARRIRTEFLK